MYRVDVQKEQAVRAWRYDAKQRGSRWLLDVVGAKGLFMDGVLDGRLPAVEFWTTRVATPLSDATAEETRDYLRMLGLHRAFGTWSAEVLPGVLLAEAPADYPSLAHSDAQSHSLLLAARESDLYAGIDWATTHRGNRNHWSELAYLEQDAASLAAAHGLYSIVEAYETKLGHLSESLLTLDLASLRGAVGRFQRLEVDFLRLSGDAMPFATGLDAARRRLANAFRFYRGTDFVSNDRGPTKSWYDGLVENVLSRVALLRTKIADTATIHGSVSSALATRANLRLQRRVTALTWVLVALTLLTAVFGALAVWDRIHRVLEWIS